LRKWKRNKKYIASNNFHLFKAASLTRKSVTCVEFFLTHSEMDIYNHNHTCLGNLFRITCFFPKNNNSPKTYNFPHETAAAVIASQPWGEIPTCQQLLSCGRNAMVLWVVVTGPWPRYKESTSWRCWSCWRMQITQSEQKYFQVWWNNDKLMVQSTMHTSYRLHCNTSQTKPSAIDTSLFC